jgi:hypothetical protein
MFYEGEVPNVNIWIAVSGLWHCVIRHMGTTVSEEDTSSVFRVELSKVGNPEASKGKVLPVIN